jgi:hypothetical protein
LQWAVTTSIDFSLAELVQVMILLSTGGKNGGGYEASKYVVIGIHGVILLLHAIINSLSISWLSFFGQLAAGWNIIGMKSFPTFFPFPVSLCYCFRQSLPWISNVSWHP